MKKATDWEYLCVEISHQKHNAIKYIISNIYRKPGEVLDEFNVFSGRIYIIFIFHNKIKIVLHTCVETIISIY